MIEAKSATSSLAATLDLLLGQLSERKSTSFRDLAEAAKLDPTRDFVGASLRDMDFRDEDLSDFNFSNADLSGADFRRANVEGMRVDGATLIGAIGLPVPATVLQGLIKDTSTQAFLKDVIEESRIQPVLVDFWAEWCGPCKQLTPTLEKVIRAAGGKIKLAKMNIDKHPAIPGQLGIQSIPAVIAFVNGQPVDGFLGALPESQVMTFVGRMTKDRVGSDAKDLLEAAAALAAGNVAGAAELYSEVLAEDTTNVPALAGLTRAHVANNALDQAKQTLALVPEAKRNDSAVAEARSALEGAEEAQSSVVEKERPADASEASEKPLFVSHVTEDRAITMEIVGKLENRGVRCWVAPRNVRVGRPFDDEIAEAIEGCRAMLLVFSDKCNDSAYIRREITVAGETGKLIVPFRIENKPPKKGLRVRLVDLHWIDAFDSRDQAIDAVITTLSEEEPR